MPKEPQTEEPKTEEKKVCRQVMPEQEPVVEQAPLKELTFDDIVTAEDLPLISIDVPEWGGQVWIRTLTGAERDRYVDLCQKRVGKNDYVDMKGLRMRLLALVLCNSAGVCLVKAEDEPKLGKKSTSVLDRLFKAARKHNRLGSELDALAEN